MKTRFIQYYWILGLMCFGFSPKTNAQTVDRFEYWFNDNFSSRTPPIPISTSSSETLLDSEVDISSLPEGLHTIHVRFGTANDTFWSSVSSFLLYRTIASHNAPISIAQYWFDDDFSHANQVAVTAQIQNEGFILDSSIGVDTLREGLHRFNIRFGGTAGWSSVSTHLYYKTNSSVTDDISLYQYWFDDNFNPADTYPITATVQNDGFLLDKPLDVTNLSEGLHRFNIRFGGTAGWSSVSTHLYYKSQDTIQGFEYWFGADFASRIYRGVTPTLNNLFLDELDTGISCDTLLQINVRFKLPASGWSSVASDTLFIRGNNNTNPFVDTITHTTCGLKNGQIKVKSPLTNALYALNNGAFQPNTLFDTLSAGTYTIKRRDIAGCQLSKTLIINASAPARIVDTTVTVCHQFQLGDTILATSGTYRRTLPSTMQCDSFVTVRLTVNQVRRDTFPPIITCADNRQDSTIYSIIKSREGCDSIIRVVQMRFLPHLTVAFDTTPTCTNRNTGATTLRLNRALNQVKIRWSTGDTTLNINHLAIGTYTVTLTDKTFCNDIRVETIVIRAARTLTASIQKTDACTGQSNGTIKILASGGIAPYRYQWSDSSRTTAVASGLKSALYRVTVTDSLACDSVQLDVRINEATALESVKKDTFYICQGDTLRVYNRFYTTQGSQEFTYPNLGGCYTSIRVVVLLKATNLNHHLNLVPRDRDTTIQMGDSIQLKLNPNFKPITIYWKSNSCVNCAMMEVKPFSDQTYFVEAQDSQKCWIRDTVSVKVKRSYYDIPNAYYPDRDSNYTVYPDKAIQRIERLRIYDRWGTLIYDSALEGAFVKGKTGWNGKFRDEPVPSGVYVVVVETLLQNGHSETITSDLILIR